jgi:dihydroorotase
MSAHDAPDLVICNAHVIDPAQDIDRVADIAVAGDRIAGIGDYSSASGARVIDASGL